MISNTGLSQLNQLLNGFLFTTDNFNNQKEVMDRLFSTYVTPQIKEIYHPAIIQEWKLNIDAA